MTSEDIKQQYSMRDILLRYGMVPDKRGYIPCPFHHEKTASMKIYKGGYNCFGCGENGDIFTFVQAMDNLTFKEAFYELGGEYPEYTDSNKFKRNLTRYKAEKKRETEQNRLRRLKERIQLNNMLINIYVRTINKSEPLSDVWCDCMNALQYQLYKSEVLNEKR
ncbi:MAG: CHC2 zinc finger domain-containing protein [Lachnotalea sp.]